jgi:hypothetical protein
MACHARAQRAKWRRGDSNPTPENHNLQNIQGLTASQENDLYDALYVRVQKHPELADLIDRWESTPEHIKMAIMALVESCKG